MATMTMDFGGSRSARPGTRAAAQRGAQAPIRLTARGRLVVRILIVALVAIVASVVLSFGKNVALSAMTDASVTTASHSVVVRSGETLWQIAAREMPSIDPRDGIARIRTLNGLSSTDTLLAGETLGIPTV